MARIRPFALVGVFAVALAAAPTAGAHGTLTPVSAPADSVQEFELLVPNERHDAGVVAVALHLPDGARLESASGVAGLWTVTSEENVVTWRGGPIDRESLQAFSFTARLPSQPGPSEFTLVESYDDGDAAPFPIPVFVTEPESGGSSSSVAFVALLLAIAAVLIALAALLVALRGSQSPPAS
jgi:uncharacterized protein YcnI